MAITDGASKITVEIDRYAHLQYGFREQMQQRGVYFVINPVKTKGRNKEGRIRQRLQPMFENGVLRTKRFMRELEEELFSFPNGTHDDLIDALAWQIESIYPTSQPIPKVDKPRRMLPTIDEMIQTLYDRQTRGRLPFDRQVGVSRFVS